MPPDPPRGGGASRPLHFTAAYINWLSRLLQNLLKPLYREIFTEVIVYILPIILPTWFDYLEGNLKKKLFMSK